ncbi:MAG: HDOD domain-containing protein [Desulfotignum sp.]|nr:HDOD domain-containing protein [Desulfotignum sp.]MCF8088446.1 HDOD domain-containing protein [Desulfotignum sp.]MCF8136447.1 HDOD domain-containing protein [Desulfotignum sp.]
MTDVTRIISQIDTLKPVSHVATRLMQLIENPDTSGADLAAVIQYDASMTANVLRLCNSVAMGGVRKVTDVKQAVNLLGIEKLISLVILADNAPNFRSGQSGYDLGYGELWRYSVSAAIIARELAEEKDAKDVSLVFTSALIKDLGKVILHTYISEAFDEIKSQVFGAQKSFLEAEKQVLGIDHAELGALAMEKWGFDPKLVDIIRHHHNPLESDNPGLALPIVYMADCICMMIGQGVGADGLAYRYYKETVDRLNMTALDMQRIIVRFREKYGQIEEMIQLSAGE